MATGPDRVERTPAPTHSDEDALRVPRQTQVYRAGDKPPAEIRADIARTRAGMTETVSSIQERLDPNRLKAEARGAVEDATIGRVRRMARTVGDEAQRARTGVMDTIRSNPIPAAMVAVGLGWLVMERSSGRAERTVTYTPPRRYYPEARERAMVPPVGRGTIAERPTGERVGETVEHARARVGEMAEQTRARVGETAGRVSETAEEARARVSHLAGEAQAEFEELGAEARERYDRTRGRLTELFEDSPLAVGAMALAAGALVGLAIPETRQERRTLGPARDRLMERAREEVSEAAERARHVAEEAGKAAEEAAREEAERQDLPH